MRTRALVVVLAAAACGGDDPRMAAAWEESSSDGTGGDTSGAGVEDSSTTDLVDETSDDAAAESSSSGGDDPLPSGPATYPADRVHSPITASVADRLRTLAEAGPEHADDVFMKTGASTDVNTNNLYCFATAGVDLGGRDDLADPLAFWLAGDAAGTTSFDRPSAATEVGRSAGWAIGGDPSPLVVELDAIAPSVAFVHFGTNDMQLGVTPLTALPGFYEAMAELLDTLEMRGVVPVIVGMTRRGDDPDADRFVATYNAVLRGLAQQRQVPWLDAHLAIDPLPGHGLGPDGLHLEAYEGGACVLDRVGLGHGYNIRNLVQLEALARTQAVIVDGIDAIDVPDPTIVAPVGGGFADDPIVVGTLPFADSRDTAIDGEAGIDVYPGCDDSDESGPEIVYAIDGAAPTAVRVVVLDRIGVDVDVH
ncbi:MAG TPA: SGNH/GDSL hydrolase family protein, partial [Nannocystaceae bacterium]|nr:SGNH/GDSL hydrolase family protein [Nannocystaceae bacterium]